MRLTLFCILCFVGCEAVVREASVYLTHGDHLKVEFDKLDPEAAAYGRFRDDLLETGWGVLDIKAGYGNKKLDDNEIMYAAGALEGALTAKHIGLHYTNLQQFFFGTNSTDVEKITAFFDKQRKWAKNMEVKYAASDAYWRQASYVASQLNGLYAGYKHVADNSTVKPTLFMIQVLNAAGDLIDLIRAVGDRKLPDFSRMSPVQVAQYVNRRGMCSALVKVTGAFEDVLMAHSSWFTYSSTNRIYKHYDFNVVDTSVASKQLSFSSYPGFLESMDDLYTLGSKMVLLQTTNNIFNTSLYDYVAPESLFAWQRVRIANALANSGSEWYSIYQKYNSGTYNNQYMVIDFKKIHLKERIDDGALWIVEQVPSLVVGADQTAILRAGYWPSYNVPFYESIYNISGYPAFVEKHGSDYTYQLAPRAKIFRRDQAKVTDMEGLKAIMRYNDYKNDPYSEGNPCNSICCRGDLSSSDPRPMGCYDSKVTNMSMALSLSSLAINGPTKGSGLTTFSWEPAFTQYPHSGLPTSYNFDWEAMKPSLE